MVQPTPSKAARLTPPPLRRRQAVFLLGVFLLLGSFSVLMLIWQRSYSGRYLWYSGRPGEISPLVMSGGNPYVRALMRTISASEANDPNPYTLLYGGKRAKDLSEHPDRCIKILIGPNWGKCTTAAGRYQFLTTTWQEKAALYHPKPSGWLFWRRYSFAPEYQDQVVYTWLNDSYAWEIDIPQRLEEGQLQLVLKQLSGTWTSLGYGIEDNKVTPYLAKIYQQLLREELAAVNQSAQE